jgi:hypothetical protein
LESYEALSCAEGIDRLEDIIDQFLSGGGRFDHSESVIEMRLLRAFSAVAQKE